MSERDLDSIDWQIASNEGSDEDDDYDDGEASVCIDLIIRENQEQKENFEIFSGFRVSQMLYNQLICFSSTIYLYIDFIPNSS